MDDEVEENISISEAAQDATVCSPGLVAQKIMLLHDQFYFSI